jgi:hypothetical protein
MIRKIVTPAAGRGTRLLPVTKARAKVRGYSTLKANKTVVGCYQSAITQAFRSGADNIFYCDLDRALHWVKTYPSELGTLAESSIKNDFILIGRTTRAFDTHPETQTLTESIGNKVASGVISLTETRDILGTTWIITPALAKLVLEIVPSNRYGFFIEWPLTLWRSARNPNYIEVEGLEWETPDRYKEEIKVEGLEYWMKRFQTTSEWRRRSVMLRDFIDSALNTKYQESKSGYSERHQK